MPESEQKYLYERLTSGDFQQLVGTLLTLQYADYRALPLGQADGGRDGLVDAPETIVFQVKWSKRGNEADPVGWLRQAIADEAPRIRRLARQGVRTYYLVTNVESTGRAGSGTFDRMRVAMSEYEEQFGIATMDCIWRGTVNHWVDNAPDETKWAYADMLAGWDLVRYLISEFVGTSSTTRIRRRIRKIAEANWRDDEQLKFTQGDVNKQRLSELFVDVNGRRVSSPTDSTSTQRTDTGGAARYLVQSPQPMTLVLGAPGQGKSTLTQYVCQSFRAAFIDSGVTTSELTPPPDDQARFPVRIELGTYAAWVDGEDVFTDVDSAPRSRKARKGKASSLESFMAEAFAYACGDHALSVGDVDDLLELVPSFIVLDGLDEVGNPKARTRVVKEIERFCHTAKAFRVPPRIVVTSRPNSSGLPEPSSEMFEVVTLEPFNDKQIASYLRKWCTAHGLRGRDGRRVREAFKDRAKEAYIGELVGNPMQLTILLELLHEQGEAAPTQRTDLYDKYMDLLLAREANKYPTSVKKHQKDLREVVPFLGWYIQSRTEEEGTGGRMSKTDVEAAMKHFQRAYGKKESVVTELINAVSDRLWALTSKEQDTFEFDIQSLREYFAARFLYTMAGEGNQNFDRTEVLRELLRRPYWLNTARFYGGNARGSDIYVMAAGVEDELRGTPTRQTLVGCWTLLTDGVFVDRPQHAATVLEHLLADRHIPTLLSCLASSEVTPLPELPQELEDNPTWTRLTSDIARGPLAPDIYHSVDALHGLLRLQGPFSRWWISMLPRFVGSASEADWFRVGTLYESGGGHQDDKLLSTADLSASTQEIVNTGLVPAPGGELVRRLVSAVLDGQCRQPTSIKSHPGRVATAFAPDSFFTSSPSGFTDTADTMERRRAEAIRALARSHPVLAAAAKRRRFAKGEHGSTFPWANTASVLVEGVGRCWIASEIAIIGAAHNHGNGFNRVAGTTAFGPESHPTTLMRETRMHKDDTHWWLGQLESATDDLAQAEWALACWAIASGPTISALLPHWETVVTHLPATRRATLVASVTTLNQSRLLRGRRVHHDNPGQIAGPLLAERSPLPSSRRAPVESRNDDLEPLAKTARDGKWLLADSLGRYR